MVSSISQKSQNSQNSENKQVKQRKKWEFQQTKKYYEFLLRHRNILQQTEKKQKQRIYNRMSDHVGTRSTHQCRSHHQKVMKRYESIDNFIAEFRRKLQTLSDPQKYQKDMGLEQGNEKKRSKTFNKKKLQLKQSSSLQGLGLNIQQQLKKLIQINRTTKQKQQIIELLRTLKGLTDKKANYQNHQTNGGQTFSISDTFRTTSNKKDNNVSSINSYQNSIPFNTSEKSQAFVGSNRMQYPYDQRRPLNEYFTISNDQINAQYGWVQRVFQNSNHYEKFKTNIFPPCENQTGFLHPDYSYVPFLVRDMAEKTLFSYSQDRPLQNFLYRQGPEQMIHNAPYVCASVIQRENLNTVNQYIKQNQIILTPQKIQIPYKKDQNSNIFVQCVKAEQLQQDQMINSNSQSIQREKIRQVLIQVLKKQGFIKNNAIIAQKQRSDFNICLMENEENKKQLQKPIFIQKEPKIQENYKFKPQYQVHHDFKTLKSQVRDQNQDKISSAFLDQYMKNRLEGKEMNEKLPKTAPCQQEVEKQSLNHYMEKNYENYGIHKIPSYQEEIHLSQDEKRKQFLAAHQYNKKLSNFQPTQEPRHSFNYNPYPFPPSPSEIPNYLSFYTSHSNFPNYGYHPSSFPYHFQQQKNHHQYNFPPNPFFNSQHSQINENFPQRKKFN